MLLLLRKHVKIKNTRLHLIRFVSDNTTLDQEMCLLDQDFIKDEDKNVAEYIATYGDVSVSSFKKVSLG